MKQPWHKRDDVPEYARLECPECSGEGWVECEHPEYDEHNKCADCGHDRPQDLMDQASQTSSADR